MLSSLLALLPLMVAADVSGSDHQVLPPCCSSQQARPEQRTLVVTGNGFDQVGAPTPSVLRVRPNGDATLAVGRDLILGRIGGQNFMSVQAGGRWITAAPEHWLRAADRGTQGLLAQFSSSISSLSPMIRTGRTRTVAGVLGDVYTISGPNGQSYEAVYTTDPRFRLAADAQWSIGQPFQQAVHMSPHQLATVRNAGFLLAIGPVATFSSFGYEDSGSLTAPSPMLSEAELRATMRARR